MARDVPAFGDCGFFGRNSRARYNKRAKVWAKTGGYCFHCKAELTFSGPYAFHSDHVLPKSLGGSNALENLVPSCSHCNLSRNNRVDWTLSDRGPKRPDFYESMGFA